MSDGNIMNEDHIFKNIKASIIDYIQQIENDFLKSISFQMRAPQGIEVFINALHVSGLDLGKIVSPVITEDYTNICDKNEEDRKKSSIKKLLNLLCLEHCYMNASQDWTACSGMQRRPDLWSMR